MRKLQDQLKKLRMTQIVLSTIVFFTVLFFSYPSLSALINGTANDSNAAVLLLDIQLTVKNTEFILTRLIT